MVAVFVKMVVVRDECNEDFARLSVMDHQVSGAVALGSVYELQISAPTLAHVRTSC